MWCASTPARSTATPTPACSRCPIEHQICLLDPDSLALVAPLATFTAAAGTFLPELEEAYRAGTGISFAGYGRGSARPRKRSTGRSSRTCSATEWIPAMPDVARRLEAPGGPCGRRRLRLRLVVDRHRPWLPELP